MKKKFELTTNTKIWFGKKLFQIRALVSFGDISVGELGGYVEEEKNLSHDGNAWVRDNALVCGNARVYGNAQVFGNAWVRDNARVCGNARVYGNAQVCGNARVYGNARVRGNAQVFGNARVCGDARVRDNAQVCGNARVCGDADYLVIGPIGSRDGFITVYRRKDNEMMVVCGCFHGTINEFEAKVAKTHGNNAHAQAYRAAIQLAKIRMMV